MPNFELILQQFNLDPGQYIPQPFGSGLIHATYIVRSHERPLYILQRVNHQVFKKPEDIAHNLRIIGNFIKANQSNYLFTSPIQDANGNDYVMDEGQYYRLFPFIQGTHTLDTCEQPGQAYEAARQFGKFTSVLKELRTDMLRYTIPGFHDLGFRYEQFLTALKEGNEKRIKNTQAEAEFLLARKQVVDRYKAIQTDPSFFKRVTHHDTKINNVLFSDNDKGVCVIDLDTVMPGYFISDLGDMIRTYVSPANEEEKDLDRIHIRKDFLDAIIEGYNEEMRDHLSAPERASFMYAGEFMIYMQALRFYTDHLNNDSYYGAKYENHNLVRAGNQMRLLSELEALI